MVEGLVAAGSDHRFTLGVKQFTIAVYYAQPRTPRQDVPLKASWAPRRVLRSIPVPSNARPDPSADGHLAIVDKANGCEYDFYAATRLPDGRITAQWASVTSLTRDGVTRGPGATSSGFALLAGLILPYELRQGHIDHALVFGYPYTRAGGPVPPAHGSDGRAGGSQAIPMGARVQLDPTLDLTTLGLRPYELTVARALQVYGAYISDTGGAVSFPVAHPQAFRRNPYAGILPDDTYVSLDRIPLSRFRVLQLPS
jgi:hypothetical protein